MKSNRFLKILYSKRDDFPFPIVRIPYLRINVPSKITYSAFGTNILKTARIKSTCNEFRSSFKFLFNSPELGRQYYGFHFDMAVILMCFRFSIIYPLHSYFF